LALFSFWCTSDWLSGATSMVETGAGISVLPFN